jgi:hypothetical protein
LCINTISLIYFELQVSGSWLPRQTLVGVIATAIPAQCHETLQSADVLFATPHHSMITMQIAWALAVGAGLI